MKTLQLEITDYTAQTWWNLAHMMFITNSSKIFNVYFTVLSHRILVISQYSNLFFREKTHVPLIGYTGNF